MRDPLGPLYQGEELLVCCLADVGDRVVCLETHEREQSPVRGVLTQLSNNVSISATTP